MTDPMSLSVAAVALGLGLAAAWFSVARVPELQGERWFKVFFATLLRGEVDQRGGAPKEWDAAVVRYVPYHPLGRQPEHKITAPSSYEPPVPALEGERRLVEALGQLDGIEARWARLYDTDEASLDARLSDPAELGDAYDPRKVLGPGAEWESVAAWSDSVPTTLDRRAPWRWVLARGGGHGSELIAGLHEALGDRAMLLAEPTEPLVLQALREQLPGAMDRGVLVLSGDALLPGLRALHQDWQLRSRVVAVLALACPIGLEPTAFWMTEHFLHEGMDVEANRATPYFAVQLLDRSCATPGVQGLPLQAQRFSTPADEGGRRHSLDRVDLGPLPSTEDLPPLSLGRSLWLTVVCWTLARR